MAKQTKLFLTKDYNNQGATFVNADGVAVKTIFTPGADGSIIRAISITSTATVTNDIILTLDNGTIQTILGHIDVNASTGTNGTTNATNGLNLTNLPFLPLDSNGSPYIPLKSGHLLRANARTAVAATAGHKIDITIFGEDF